MVLPPPFSNTSRGAFTIIESIVVLVILTILTMVILALIKFQMKPQIPARLQPKTSETTLEGPTPIVVTKIS